MNKKQEKGFWESSISHKNLMIILFIVAIIGISIPFIAEKYFQDGEYEQPIKDKQQLQDIHYVCISFDSATVTIPKQEEDILIYNESTDINREGIICGWYENSKFYIDGVVE